jgi:hypothetical protein
VLPGRPLWIITRRLPRCPLEAHRPVAVVQNGPKADLRAFVFWVLHRVTEQPEDRSGEQTSETSKTGDACRTSLAHSPVDRARASNR